MLSNLQAETSKLYVSSPNPLEGDLLHRVRVSQVELIEGQCASFSPLLSPPLSSPCTVWLRFRIPRKKRTRLSFQATWQFSRGRPQNRLCCGVVTEIAVLRFFCGKQWSADLVNIVIQFSCLRKEWQYVVGCAKTCPPASMTLLHYSHQALWPFLCRRDIGSALHKYSQVKSPIQ